MSKKFLLAIAMFFVLILTGCSLKNSATNVGETFYVSGPNWSGGMGSMPILESARGNVKEQDGLPIFVDETTAELIRAKMPDCYTGNSEVKVTAKIQLEKKESVITSMPPDENGNQPTRSYYSANILELKDVQVKAEECKD